MMRAAQGKLISLNERNCVYIAINRFIILCSFDTNLKI